MSNLRTFKTMLEEIAARLDSAKGIAAAYAEDGKVLPKPVADDLLAAGVDWRTAETLADELRRDLNRLSADYAAVVLHLGHLADRLEGIRDAKRKAEAAREEAGRGPRFRIN